MEQAKFKEAYAASIEQFQKLVQKECKVKKRKGPTVVKLPSHANSIY